ncbi:MAG: pitrilysin family protein [Candidatus Velthaea sp.]
MKLRRFVASALAAAVLLCGVRVAPARAADSSVAAEAQIRTLANGLRVVVLEDHAAPVVQVATWYRFGAGYETPGKTGLAHGLEHMMFRGTPSLSAAGIDDLGARLGAEFNAQTTNEYTHFYFVVPADRTDLMIHVEADRMTHLKLDPKDWAVEKQAVLQEWDQDYSNPFFKFLFGINERIYPNSALSKPALGVRDDIVKSTAADLRKYYSEYYAPNNATLVVTGDIKAADAFASAQKWFGPLPSHKLPATELRAPQPAAGDALNISAEFPFEILDLAYALPGDNPQTEIPLARAQLALAALQNERGPFRKALVDSGLTLGYFVLPLTERHASAAHALFIVAPGHTIEEVRAAYDTTLAATLKTGIDADYIEAARRSSIASLTYSRDSITGLGDGIGAGYVFPGDTDPAKAEALLRGISVDDVNGAARTYLAKPNVIGVLTPTTTDPSKAKPPSNISGGVSDNFTGRVPSGPIVQAAWVSSGIKKPLVLASRVKPQAFTLPNGLRLLVQEVHTNPTVIITGNVRGSDTFDPVGKEGLSDLTAALLNYGSAKYDFGAQRKLADDLGAELNFGQAFSAHGFSKDTGTFIDALADDLAHPLFPAERFALVRTQETASVTRRALQPQYRSARAFAEALYPAGDPALRQDTSESLAAITPDDVKAYAEKYYRPDLTTIAVVGDVNAAEVRAKVESAFGGWTAAGPKPDPKLPPIPLPAPVRKLVETPSIDESVQLGTPALARTSPDYDAFRLMNSILGNGSFDSRLMEEVRTKRGLVYNISSSLSAGRDRGTLTISFRAIPSKADAAVAIVQQQLRRLQTEPVRTGDLERQKIKLAASAVIAEQSTYAIAGDVINIGSNDLPLDYYATFATRFAKITPAEIERVAKTYLHPDNLVEVRTGPKAK